MGRGKQSGSGNASNSQGGKNFGNKYTPKHKQVQKDPKQKRQKSAQPQRKTSKPNIEIKQTPTHNPGLPANLNKPKYEPKPPRGPIDPAKVSEVKQRLQQLEELINTYDEVEMDKETNIRNLMQFIEKKEAKIKYKS